MPGRSLACAFAFSLLFEPDVAHLLLRLSRGEGLPAVCGGVVNLAVMVEATHCATTEQMLS